MNLIAFVGATNQTEEEKLNRADTLRALANEQNRGWPIVVPAQKCDYVLGVTKQNVKQGYYTKLFSDVDDQMVVKAGEDLRAHVAVTLQGFADDSTEYMYGTLYGYTIGPWNMALLAMRYGSNTKAFEREKEKFTWHPEESETK
jgi:hypothetical protein